MAGERLAKLTLRADWTPGGFTSGYQLQTKEIRLLLNGQWERFGNDQ